MIVSAQQPLFMPWIGFFNKISLCDVFLLADSLQFTKKSWIHRNEIYLSQERAWLSVPVLTSGRFGQSIREVQIANIAGRDWRQKHWAKIWQSYHRAPYFEMYGPFFQDLYSREWEWLVDLNEAIIRFVVEALGLSTQIYATRELDLQLVGSKNDLILQICQRLGGDTYLLGIGYSQTYVDDAYLDSHGIKLLCQSFEHPVYPQMRDSFEPRLSIIDLLFNCGDKSREFVVNSGWAVHRKAPISEPSLERMQD